MRSAILQCVVVMLLGASACSNYSQPSGNVPVQGVKLTPQSIQLAIGETKQLQATLAPTNATDKVIVWESTNEMVASVDNTGLVTARGTGAGVLITVVTHDGGHEASTNVTVGP